MEPKKSFRSSSAPSGPGWVSHHMCVSERWQPPGGAVSVTDSLITARSEPVRTCACVWERWARPRSVTEEKRAGWRHGGGGEEPSNLSAPDKHPADALTFSPTRPVCDGLWARAYAARPPLNSPPRPLSVCMRRLLFMHVEIRGLLYREQN